ncbi:MAG: hypothetical protein PWP57_850, partial [Candidatus Atribacteria bacterium]|nr:hypothetical protein [Candidatus Atribacteria bacterium]
NEEAPGGVVKGEIFFPLLQADRDKIREYEREKSKRTSGAPERI